MLAVFGRKSAEIGQWAGAPAGRRPAGRVKSQYWRGQISLFEHHRQLGTIISYTFLAVRKKFEKSKSTVLHCIVWG
jgi:hypothetical protein